MPAIPHGSRGQSFAIGRNCHGLHTQTVPAEGEDALILAQTPQVTPFEATRVFLPRVRPERRKKIPGLSNISIFPALLRPVDLGGVEVTSHGLFPLLRQLPLLLGRHGTGLRRFALHLFPGSRLQCPVSFHSALAPPCRRQG
jgi:hypothetical protein